MGEVCDGMRALCGKLNYLGMDCSPSKSTAGDALRDRDNELFKLYYFALIAYFMPVLSVSRKEKVSFEEFYASDSTTISLFSNVMKGVGRNPKDDGKKKGGLKVHMLTDVHADTAVFAKISEAKMHDKKFLQHLNPTKGSMLVFDKALLPTIHRLDPGRRIFCVPAKKPYLRRSFLKRYWEKMSMVFTKLSRSTCNTRKTSRKKHCACGWFITGTKKAGSINLSATIGT